MSVKEQIKNKLPKTILLFNKYKKKIEILLNVKENKDVFNEIYEKNIWEDAESISGPGSTIENTINFYDALLRLVQNYKIRILLDVPCGDFNWMKELNLQLDNYIGMDVVDKLIQENARNMETII